MRLTNMLMCVNSIISYKNLPACINCIYFREYPNNNPYDPLPDETIHLSKCEKFGKQNMVSGYIQYELAEKCRNDQNMCGNSAKYYKLKDALNISIIIDESFGNLSDSEIEKLWNENMYNIYDSSNYINNLSDENNYVNIL